jgi:GT2 family glycosyltransferase
LRLLQVHKERLKVIHLPKECWQGARIEKAAEIAKGGIFLFTDSDCDIEADALEKAIEIFLSDPTIGAVTVHAPVIGTTFSATKRTYIP